MCVLMAMWPGMRGMVFVVVRKDEKQEYEKRKVAN